jgi:peptidoglycan-associated lipoprotein
VVTYLVDKGIDKARLTSDGKGPDEPLVKDASTAEDLAQNRRVEFKIVN